MGGVLLAVLCDHGAHSLEGCETVAGLTCALDELAVLVRGEERSLELAEVGLENTGHSSHVHLLAGNAGQGVSAWGGRREEGRE